MIPTDFIFLFIIRVVYFLWSELIRVQFYFIFIFFIPSELVRVDPSWSDPDWRSELIRSDFCTCLNLIEIRLNKRIDIIFDLHIQLHSLLANYLTTFWKKIGTMALRLRLIILALFLVMLDDSQVWKQPGTQTPPICSLIKRLGIDFLVPLDWLHLFVR